MHSLWSSSLVCTVWEITEVLVVHANLEVEHRNYYHGEKEALLENTI